MGFDLGVRCPHCNERNTHVTEEFPGEEGTWETVCEHCRCAFRVSRKVVVEYSARKVSGREGAAEGQGVE